MTPIRLLLAVALAASTAVVPPAARPVAAAPPQDAVSQLERLPGGGLVRYPTVGVGRSFRLRAVAVAGAGVAGVAVVGQVVSGPNAASADGPGVRVTCSTTASEGSASCSYTPQRAGTDTVRAHVDQSSGRPGVFDTGEPFLDAGFLVEPAPNTNVTEARTISMDPESTTFYSHDGVSRLYTATVRDSSGIAVKGALVEFTEQGAGALDGRAASITGNTDELGRVTVGAAAYGAPGEQVITGRIATVGTQCGRAADDPAGAPAGACADTSTVTYSPHPGPLGSGSPPPSPSPTPHGDCLSGEQVRAERAVIVAGEGVRVTITSTPDTLIDLHGYIRPSTTVRLLDSVRTASDGRATASLRLLGNTRVAARQRVEDCTDPVGSAPSIVVSVRTRLTLTAVRNAPRDYAFSGRALPVRTGQAVSLYRLAPGGRQVLTSRTTVRADGTWTVVRPFTGSGQFDFVARTSADVVNAAGASNVRPTVVH